jgi:hypothetical protein
MRHIRKFNNLILEKSSKKEEIEEFIDKNKMLF